MPTAGGVGFSYQFGPRPTNPPWISAEDACGSRRSPAAQRDGREPPTAKTEEEEIAAVQARGGPDVEICVQAVKQRYARKYAEIKQSRKEIKKLAWDMLRKQYRSRAGRAATTCSRLTCGSADGSTNGVGVESFLFQTVQRSGEDVTVSPRLGFETEVSPKRIKLRAGHLLWSRPALPTSTPTRPRHALASTSTSSNGVCSGSGRSDYRWQITSGARPR